MDAARERPQCQRGIRHSRRATAPHDDGGGASEGDNRNMANGGNSKGLLKDLKKTVVIEKVAPAVDCGRYPVKREVGADVEVTADIFREGHETLLAFVKYRRVDAERWREAPMRFVDNDRWA